MIFRNLIVFIYFILINILLYSQPTILTTKCYGGPGGDGPKSIKITSDNGRLIVGTSGGNGGDVSGWHDNSDAWVVKTDSSGNIQWQKCLGGIGWDNGVDGVETMGGFVIASSGGSFDGNQTGNHGIEDYWIVKLDYNGNILWEYSYGGTEEEVPYGIATTPDGGFIISGNEHSLDTGDIHGHHGGPGGDDIWVIKIDSSGLLQWQKCIGSTWMDLFGQVVVDSIGNIYITAAAGLNDGDVTCFVNGHSAWLVKLDSSGNILWDKCFGGSNGEQINSIEIKGNRLLMSGWSGSSDGDFSHNYGYSDAWILLTDTSGNKIFSQTYGGSLSDEFYNATFTFDNRIIAGGITVSTDYDVTMIHAPASTGDGWLVCVDTLGNLIMQQTYGGSSEDIIESVLSFPNRTIQFAALTSTPNDGDVTGSHGLNDIWTVTLDIVNDINKTELKNNFKIFPQPFSDYINIHLPFSTFNNKITSVKLFNIEGKQINSSINIGESELRITPKENLLPGLYILELITNNNVYDFKVLKM